MKHKHFVFRHKGNGKDVVLNTLLLAFSAILFAHVSKLCSSSKRYCIYTAVLLPKGSGARPWRDEYHGLTATCADVTHEHNTAIELYNQALIESICLFHGFLMLKKTVAKTGAMQTKPDYDYSQPSSFLTNTAEWQKALNQCANW